MCYRTLTQNLNPVILSLDQPRLSEGLEIYRASFFEAVEVRKVDDGNFFSRGIHKPPFGKAADEWHLTALKP
jgi:hypothetical protein